MADFSTAASLNEPFKQLGREYEEKSPGAKVIEEGLKSLKESSIQFINY